MFDVFKKVNFEPLKKNPVKINRKDLKNIIERIEN